MKTTHIIAAACLLAAFTGCKEETVDTFNSAPGVNFLVSDGYGGWEDDYENLKTEASFFEEYFYQQSFDIGTQLDIPLCVQLEGRLSDRPLNVSLTAVAEDGYDMPQLVMPGDSAIAAGEYRKEFNVTCMKPDLGKEQRCYITFDYAKSDVVAGTMERQKYEIVVSDVTPWSSLGVTDEASWNDAFSGAFGPYGEVKMRFIMIACAQNRWGTPNAVYTIFRRHVTNPNSGFNAMRMRQIKNALTNWNNSHEQPLQEADGTLVTFP